MSLANNIVTFASRAGSEIKAVRAEVVAEVSSLNSQIALKANSADIYTIAAADNAILSAVGADSILAISSADSSVYADSSVAPMEDPLGRSGWHFKNSVAGRKVNWYPYNNTSNNPAHTKAALTSVWAVITFYNTLSKPFVTVYSPRLGDGLDAASWYRSRWTLEQYAFAPVINTKYLVYFGTDPGVFSELPRLSITDFFDAGIDRGPRLNTEVLSMFAWGTSSAALVNEENWTMHALGHTIAKDAFNAPLVHVGATSAALATVTSNLALKANSADVYTIAAANAAVATAIAVKANSADVYTKAESDSGVSTAINNLINSAPGTLDTLGEIATALENDESVAVALAALVALKANSADVYTKAESDSGVSTAKDDIETKLGANYDTSNFVTSFEAALL